jgi:hypothetical protein
MKEISGNKRFKIKDGKKSESERNIDLRMDKYLTLAQKRVRVK